MSVSYFYSLNSTRKMKSYIVAGFLALVLIAGTIPLATRALEQSDIGAQIETLLARIAELQAKIAELQGISGQTNQPPIGYAGNIRGGIAHGWTLDPDEPTAKIGFHVYIDGPVGKGGTYVAGGRAGQNRQDITPDKESYGHWYEFVIPDQYRDGKDHTLYVYGIDSKLLKGNNTLLKNNPKSFNIARGSIPPLFLPGDRVKTSANLNARATPSIKGDIVGEEPKGSLGTIVAGPTNAGGYTWWQIDYDNNISGWSADTYLVEVSTPPSEETSCTITATPTSVTSGQSSTLSWTSTNANQGTIDNGAGNMTPIASGSKSVSPTSSTLYTATVTGAGVGASTTCEASVDVTSGSDTTKPTVSLTAPADGATVSGTVTISANASDNVGVVGVQFKVDGTNVGAEDTTAPYSIAWNSTTATNGTHTIRAVARDAAGNTRWSAVRSVTVSNTTTSSDIITVQGNKILRNGQSFEVHGVQLMSFVAPREWLLVGNNDGPYTSYLNAYDHFQTSGSTLLDYAKSFGANTILFKLSARGLDSQHALYTQEYIDKIIAGVALARSKNFVVILSIQENSISGEPNNDGMPDAGTQRAALKLTELFGNDRSIIIELFGEPFGPTWNAYLNGGTVSGKQYVGINQIIASMRSAGSRNVVIVNALGQDYSKYLNQSQRFSDSLGQLAYGVHTYFSMVGHSQAGVPGVDNHGGWDSNYGNFATTHPTLVTEWNQNTLRAGNTTEEWCTVVPLDMPLKAFHYFKDKKLNGAVGWSFDLTTTIVKDLIGTPRTLEGFACGQSGGGIGRLFQQYFLGTLPAALSHGDRVKTTAILNVRATPSGSGTKVGTVPLGSLGTIVGGPTKTANYTFWQIDWDSRISGWSVERYLEKVITPTGTSCTLTASPASITAGNSSTLSWTSTNATSGTINQGVGAMTPIAAGTKSVSPTSSTLYTATVTGAGGSATCSARVGVGVTPPPSNDVITVQGNKILRNGQPFIMKGVVFESSQYTDADLAFCSSPGHTDEVSCKKRKDSRDYYIARGAFASGNDVFSVLPQWGANTIRLNLGQALLDPQSPYYDSAYVQMVADSVKRARDRGYIVIVSPFAGRNDRAGVYLNSHNPDTPLDSASTLRANETLAGLFKNDRGVIFETLNEPYWTHNATGWGYWLNGGTNVGPNGWNFVGVNAVINAVRATGARNVIIAQGIGASFEGFPGGVIDSAGQLAYSAHPFLNKGPYESDWQARFGTFAATHPFLITAWGSNTNDDWCANTATDISRPLEFLNYLKQRDIGLAGWAFDASGAGSITKDFNTNPGAPSVLGAKCGDNGGVGTLVQQYFLGTLPSALSQGDRVEATAILNVRATPSGSGTRVSTVPLGSIGTIVGGPTKTANYTFWQIDWDSRISGWSVESYLAKATVLPNLIGPLYVFAGQSNMIGAGADISQLAGRAKGDTLQGVRMWNNLGNTFENIQLGVNTVQWPQANQVTFDKFGTEWAVAERSSAGTKPTYIVKVAKGGSSLLVDADWNPSASDNLTTKLINAVSGAKAASNSPLACFVWIQGEADRGKTSRLTEYSNNLGEITTRVRIAGGNSSARIAVVELSYGADGLDVSNTDSFRAMQQAFVAADPHASLIDTDDLTKVDNVHYDTASIMTLGNRIYNACNNTDTTKPTVSLTAPADGATVSGTVTISASASDNVGVVGVQFKVDGVNVGAEDTTAPYSIAWDSTTATNGAHTIKAVAKDAAGNTASTAGRSVTVSNNVVTTPTIEGPQKSAVDALKGWTVTGGDPASTFTINWGDGTARSQTKTFGEKVWHTYRSGGSYSLTAEVTRPGGAKVTAQSAVIVTPLKYLFCDIKRPVAKRQWNLSQSNYRQVIDAFKSELGCNGIRFGIDSKTLSGDTSKIAPDSTPESYTQLYRDAYAYARQKNLLIYANMLPEKDVLNFGGDETLWADTVVAYTNHFCPDFVGPFNEEGVPRSGLMRNVAVKVKADLASSPCKAKLVGPDNGTTDGAARIMNTQYRTDFLSTFTIVSAHNNGNYGQFPQFGVRVASKDDWLALDTAAGGHPVWASESGADWSVIDPATSKEYGVTAIVDSGVVSGLVLYMAPNMLEASGSTYTLATKGLEIAQGLCAAGWDRSCPKVLGASTTREDTLIESVQDSISTVLGMIADLLRSLQTAK